MTAVLVVGVPTAFLELFGEGGAVRDPAWVWWVAYGLYVAAFVLDGVVAPSLRPRWAGEYRVFVVQLITGIVVVAASPEAGWTAVVLVVTAASAAFGLPVVAVGAVVALQTLALAVVLASSGWDTTVVTVNVVIYGAFQAFAVLVTLGQRREAEARAELAATHAELRATTSLLATSTRTAERLRISRDLHDLVGHQLTGLALELEVASHHATGPAADHVSRARGIAKDLLRDVREAVGELRHGPQRLEPVLRQLVGDLPGLEVDLTVDERATLDEASAVAVVRCVQEVVTNTLRHAHARHLVVRVVADDDGVHLTAHDDGRGARDLTLGYGLTGLRERVEQLGGEVTFGTDDGRPGFALTARVPAP